MSHLLVLQSAQRTPARVVDAAKAYAHTRWLLDEQLRKTLAGSEYLNQETVHRTGPRQALLAPGLASLVHEAEPSPELCFALGLTTEASAAFDYSVITINAKGQIAVADNFKDAPGLCLTLLAEKACAHAQRHLNRGAMSTRSTAYSPVLTASAVERAEGVDLKAARTCDLVARYALRRVCSL